MPVKRSIKASPNNSSWFLDNVTFPFFLPVKRRLKSETIIKIIDPIVITGVYKEPGRKLTVLAQPQVTIDLLRYMVQLR